MAGPASPSSCTQKRNTLLKGIKPVLVLVFVGYLVVWGLAPTNLWRKNWLQNIRSKTDYKSFGQQGANILLYAFPILFIAALDGVYLQLGKKAGTCSQRYMVSINAICACYALLAIIFSWLKGRISDWVFFVSDQVLAYLLVTTGSLTLYLLRRVDKRVTWREACSSYGSFCSKMKISLVLQMVALKC